MCWSIWWSGFVAACLTLGAFAAAQEAAPPDKRLMVILKLDDVTTNGASGKRAIAPRWQKVAEFVEREGIKANFGIIGWSLEEDKPAYHDWIKTWHGKGVIEFWNHGYKNRKTSSEPDEFAGSLDEQAAALRATQRLAKERLGLTLTAFGPHWSGTNAQTPQALAQVPEIKVWFGSSSDQPGPGLKVLITDRLERPTFIPNYDHVVRIHDRIAKGGRGYMVLQGHPNKWDDARWDDFTKIIAFLKEKECRFVTISEFLESTDAQKQN